MLELKNITKSYGKAQIIKGIDLTFDRGEVVFVVGRSGCGKTTLLNLIGGLDSANSGEIVFDGRVVTHKSVEYKQKSVGFVFQDYNLVSGMTAAQTIAIAKRDYGRDWIEQNIRDLGLKTKQKTQTLSGGEKQRLALLRALYKDAQIVLADEPTGNLDSQNSDIVFEHICQLREQNKIVIIVTHDRQSAEKFGDRIIELRDGAVLSDERVDKVAYRPQQLQALDSLANNQDSTNKGRFFANGVIVLNSLKQRKFRAIALILILAIAISFVATVWGLFVGAVGVQSNMVYYMDLDVAEFFVNDYTNNSLYSMMFSDKQIEQIRSWDEVDSVVPSFEDNGNFGGVNGTRSELVFTQSEYPSKEQLGKSEYIRAIDVDTTDYFRSRIMSNNDILGRYIQTENEIVIGVDILDKVFSEVTFDQNTQIADFLQEKIFVRPSNNELALPIPVDIVGINMSEDRHGNTPSFVHCNLQKQLVSLNDNQQTLMEDRFRTVYGVDDDDEYYTLGYHIRDRDFSIIYGTTQLLVKDDMDVDFDMPVGREILINEYLAKTLEDKNLQLHELDIVLHYRNERYTEVRLGTDTKVKGVFDNGSDKPQIIVGDQILQELTVAAFPRSVMIYLKSPQQYKALKERIQKELVDYSKQFMLISLYDDYTETIYRNTSQLKDVALVMLILIVLVALIGIVIVLAFGIKDRTYEMTVYRSMGFGKVRVLGLFFAEVIAMFVLAFVLSFVLATVVQKTFGLIAPDIGNLKIMHPIYNMTVVALSLFVIGVLTTMLCSKKLLTQTIATLFKS